MTGCRGGREGTFPVVLVTFVLGPAPRPAPPRGVLLSPRGPEVRHEQGVGEEEGLAPSAVVREDGRRETSLAGGLPSPLTDRSEVGERVGSPLPLRSLPLSTLPTFYTRLSLPTSLFLHLFLPLRLSLHRSLPLLSLSFYLSVLQTVYLPRVIHTYLTYLLTYLLVRLYIYSIPLSTPHTLLSTPFFVHYTYFYHSVFLALYTVDSSLYPLYSSLLLSHRPCVFCESLSRQLTDLPLMCLLTSLFWSVESRFSRPVCPSVDKEEIPTEGATIGKRKRGCQGVPGERLVGRPGPSVIHRGLEKGLRPKPKPPSQSWPYLRHPL